MVKILDIDTSSITSTVKVKRTYEGFEKYGVAVNADHLKNSVKVEEANQGSALKFVKVAPCENHYNKAPSGHAATTNWNIFRASVQPEKWEGKVYNLTVLERHPYSTQTFVPMGRSGEEDTYVVNVAPPAAEGDQPDVEKVESFIFDGVTAVTYNRGVWHSPMVVLGKTTDFCVVTNENDVPKENTEEVFFTPGIKVDITK